MNDLPTNRRQWLRLSLGTGALLGGATPGLCASASNATAATVASSGPAPAAMIWRSRRMQGLGTHLHLQAGQRVSAAGAVGTTAASAAAEAIADTKLAAALDAAVQAIRHVEQQFSLYDPNSALCRLNREGVLHQPHPDFVRLMRVAQHVSAQSGGHFDATVQPLWAVWQHAITQGRLPTAQEINHAKARVGWQKVEVSANKIRFLQPGMGITLNGVAQGFAGDLAQAALRAHGIEHALLDTGEWLMQGQAPGGEPWRLGLQHPRAQHPEAGVAAGNQPVPAGLATSHQLLAKLTTDGRAVATSSDVNQRFSANGTHHHIFNPATGYSPRGLASITVLAGSGAMADALTKVMFMGDVAQAMRLAQRWQVDVLAVDKAGRWQATRGLQKNLES